MVRIRTYNEIVLSSIDYYKTVRPLLDTKVGQSVRDVIIDGPSTQLARLYEELSSVSSVQSLRTALGADLDKFASNFGITRNSGTKSYGQAVLTFKSIVSDIDINKGDLINSRNGLSFSVQNSLTVSPVLESLYKSIASKYRADLDYLGITDEYAVEVLVTATTSGAQGNISKYSIISTNIPTVSNATNITPFTGGKDVESDSAFRNRVFAGFSGANTGTAIGYSNAIKADAAVIDVVVIEPGDSLMTRDGTQVSIASDGTRTIISEGTGGKVDVYVFGTRIQETSDSYIYRDLSNTGNPTNSKNDFVLGQILEDANKTVTKKRIDNLESGILPSQPIYNIVSVAGSLSGQNFVEKSIDSLGRITGNYELLKDSGAYAGSPWGFDKIHWISNQISNFGEDKTKLAFNGQDPLSFADLLEVQGVVQNISIVNEVATINSSDRSIIQLQHYPISNVTRVFNSTTGERYVILDQNPDGEGSLNTTGRIFITGQTLPAVSDIVQVDYVWQLSYDQYFDFDNKVSNKNIRSVGDSVDWGLSNAIHRERATLVASGSYLTATVSHPISAVVNVNVFNEQNETVTLSSGRLSVVVSYVVSNVVSIVRASDGVELWNTDDADGTFSGMTIFLPTDTLAQYGDRVAVVYNAQDVYNVTEQKSFSSNIISISPSGTAVAGRLVECNYIADINTLLSNVVVSDLPAIRSSNAFSTDSLTNVGCQPTTHIFDSNGSILSNLRLAPTNLSLAITGTISNGIITVSGITIHYMKDIVFKVGTNGLKQSLSAAIRTYLGLSSITSIPSNISISKISKLEKVNSTELYEVLNVEHTYDLIGYQLYNNNFAKSESVQNSTLSPVEIQLPETQDNIDNAPEVGDYLRVRCYITKTNDSENVKFSKAGTQYTKNKFAIIDTISVSSGFTTPASLLATLTVSSMNQPAVKSRYKAYYDYTAPKPNERITIKYNYDKLIGDSTLLLEQVRPINADVLAKQSVPILIDITAYIVVTNSYINSSEIVRQNVQNELSKAISSNKLNLTLDANDLIPKMYAVVGVDRARITYFNRNGVTGSVLSIIAQKNEYLAANNVNVIIETR